MCSHCLNMSPSLPVEANVACNDKFTFHTNSLIFHAMVMVKDLNREDKQGSKVHGPVIVLPSKFSLFWFLTWQPLNYFFILEQEIVT